MAIHRVLFEQFVAAHPKPPRRLVLDFDATDTPLHGEQEDRFFQGYYDGYCYLPLYVFCGRHLLVSYLRPSGIDAARHAWGILSLLVKALWAHWPGVKIVFRGDSGFCRWRMLRWCESHGVGYIVGVARNSRVQEEGPGTVGPCRGGIRGHGQEAAPVRFGMVRGTDLGSCAAGDRVGGAWRPGSEPPLRSDQPGADRSEPV